MPKLFTGTVYWIFLKDSSVRNLPTLQEHLNTFLHSFFFLQIEQSLSHNNRPVLNIYIYKLGQFSEGVDKNVFLMHVILRKTPYLYVCAWLSAFWSVCASVLKCASEAVCVCARINVACLLLVGFDFDIFALAEFTPIFEPAKGWARVSLHLTL